MIQFGWRRHVWESLNAAASKRSKREQEDIMLCGLISLELLPICFPTINQVDRGTRCFILFKDIKYRFKLQAEVP